MPIFVAQLNRPLLTTESLRGKMPHQEIETAGPGNLASKGSN